jgi:hypothetical protein
MSLHEAAMAHAMLIFRLCNLHRLSQFGICDRYSRVQDLLLEFLALLACRDQFRRSGHTW